MSWLPDTNVISELTRRSPNDKVVQWLLDKEDDLFLSVLTLGEIQKGILNVSDETRRERLEQWLAHEIMPWFAGRKLPVDEPVALRWGKLVAEAGRPLPAIDSLIAATAQVHDLTLATRNTEDMKDTGVALFNPWTE